MTPGVDRGVLRGERLRAPARRQLGLSVGGARRGPAGGPGASVGAGLGRHADPGPADGLGDARPVEAEAGEDVVGLALGQVLPGTPRTRVAGNGRPADSTCAAMASRRKAPAPPWRTPSSAVTTRRWRAASSSMVASAGETTRASHTVASIPSAASSSAALRQAPTILPTPSRQTDPSPTRSWRAASPRPPGRGPTCHGAVLGTRMVDGPASSSAVRSMGSTSSAEEGAKTVMPGMESARARSRMPWWLGPSSPVMPARSSTNTTGQPCRPTSRLAWSKERDQKVE